MRSIVMGGLIAVCLLVVADYTVAAVQMKALSSRVGNDDLLRALSDLIAPGMTRSEVEHLLNGFRESKTSPETGQYSVSYRYWFGIIPPLGPAEIKLIGAVDVVYSNEGRVKRSHYWLN